MRIIFLDFDGVLNSESYVRQCRASGVIIDPTRLTLIKDIVAATAAKIVLSTSWREHWDADRLKCDGVGQQIYQIFEQKGLQIMDKTPMLRGNREREIELWLQAHPETEEFVVLDDRFMDSPVIRGHFVKTANYRSGLDTEDVQKAIDILCGR